MVTTINSDSKCSSIEVWFQHSKTRWKPLVIAGVRFSEDIYIYGWKVVIPAKPDSKCSSLKDYFQHSNSQCEVPNGDGEGAILRRLHGDHLGAGHREQGVAGVTIAARDTLRWSLSMWTVECFVSYNITVLVAIVLYKPKHFYMLSGWEWVQPDSKFIPRSPIGWWETVEIRYY